jgi:hypothetical protein
MSESQETTQPSSDIERLIQDLFASDEVEFSVVSGDHLFIAFLPGGALRFRAHGSLSQVKAAGWQLFSELGGAIRRARFIREPDHHDPEQESLSVHLIGANGMSALRFSFTHLYDDKKQPIAARFGRWAELRAKYGGQDEVEVEKDGRLATPVGR